MVLFALSCAHAHAAAMAGWRGEVLNRFELFQQMREFAHGVIDTRSVVFLEGLTFCFFPGCCGSWKAAAGNKTWPPNRNPNQLYAAPHGGGVRTSPRTLVVIAVPDVESSAAVFSIGNTLE